MQIALSSILVEDQDRALRFYTDVLGFQKKHYRINFAKRDGRWRMIFFLAGD